MVIGYVNFTSAENTALPATAGDSGSFPGSGRSPAWGNGSPLQYSCLENARDRGAWWATVHGVAKSQTRLSIQHTHTKQWTGNTRVLHLLKGSRPLGKGNESFLLGGQQPRTRFLLTKWHVEAPCVHGHRPREGREPAWGHTARLGCGLGLLGELEWGTDPVPHLLNGWQPEAIGPSSYLPKCLEWCHTRIPPWAASAAFNCSTCAADMPNHDVFFSLYAPWCPVLYTE